jgi:dTDP-4-dehydrorhamnose reductase
VILVLGGGGQLARELDGLASARGVALTAPPRRELDITDTDAVAAAIARTKPALVINAAAYTAVDRAETEIAAAMAVNADAPGRIAAQCDAAGIPLIHVSTDYVFAGDKTTPYREDDPVSPLGVYGASKAAGEAAVRAAAARHLILRTAWVYGAHGANFLKTMLRLARERDELRVVADQRGCPTSTRSLAEAMLLIAPRLIEAAGTSASPLWGTYHFCGTGETSWHGFATEIVRAQARFTGRSPVVTPISTAEYPTPARRPANAILDTAKFGATFGHRAPPWQADMQAAVAEILMEKR